MYQVNLGKGWLTLVDLAANLDGQANMESWRGHWLLKAWHIIRELRLIWITQYVGTFQPALAVSKQPIRFLNWVFNTGIFQGASTMPPSP